VCPRGYEEDKSLDAKVWECLHIAHLMEQADRFDIIHNHFDFLPLSYSRLISTPMVTTIHGFSSPRILPVYRRYQEHVAYVSISDADRAADLRYAATVYNGIRSEEFTFRAEPGRYLLSLGRIHPDKGTAEAVRIAERAGMPLLIAGIVQDERYFHEAVEPLIDGERVRYLGHADPAERDRLLGEAFALLHPIAFEEPFGLTVVEAMACGTPVIAFARGSMPELIRPGVTGFLTSDVEGAAEAVSHVPGIDRRSCREHVRQHFTAERMVEGYIAVYEQVLSRRRA
jgi:glycosyltransferase involved in cell wall biosynthesis